MEEEEAASSSVRGATKEEEECFSCPAKLVESTTVCLATALHGPPTGTEPFEVNPSSAEDKTEFDRGGNSAGVNSGGGVFGPMVSFLGFCWP